MKVSVLIVCLFALLFSFSTKLLAVDFMVNLTTDQHDANASDGICDIDLATAGSQCSIRAAVEQANSLVSNDRVLFGLAVNSTITLSNANDGEILINNNGSLEILGTGANILTIIGGAGPNRIFATNFATVTISGMTLTGGNGVGSGDSGNGGAIYAEGGLLTLDRVYVMGNDLSPGFSGGGAYFESGTHRIINSTISGNSAGECAGFSNTSGSTLTVVNSTISGNMAGSSGGGGGGGFCNLANITLRNVTITNNSTLTDGGGFTQLAGTLNFGNTIVAGNTARPRSPVTEINFESGTIISAGGNLVGDSSGDSTNTTTPITYQTTDKQNVNPLLGGLQNYGGTTPTHALFAGSPAIDFGLDSLAVDPFNNAALAFDQRGANFIRIADGNSSSPGARVDIGAYELMASTAAKVSISGTVRSSGGTAIANAIVYLTKPSGQVLTATTNSAGYYTFQNIEVGNTYVFNVTASGYQFNSRVVNVMEEWEDLDFTAQ